MSFWDDFFEFITCVILPTILIFAGVAALVFPIMGYTTGRQIKYNCELDRAPSLHMSMMIDTDVYDYAPEKFCADVRNRMAKGK